MNSQPNLQEFEHFGDRIARACQEKRSLVCVGLDPRWKSLPEVIKQGVDEHDLEAVADATECYCNEVIDAVADSAPVVKPQAAFFELLGPAGMKVLWRVIQYARKVGLIVLLDGKRGDIGSTAEGYADAYLGMHSPWKCDALTINPYLGEDTLAPFTNRAQQRGCGVFVLVKTSNPGSGFLQDVPYESGQLFEHVARKVQALASDDIGSCGYGNVGAVVGATYPEQLASLREAMPNTWLLIPGFGAQGGTAEDVRVGFGRDAESGNPTGAVVNSSRGIIFAYQQQEFGHLEWQEAVGKAAQRMREQLF